MPIPTPNSNEDRDDFIDRCMENSTMMEDFPDSDQRMAVCVQQWDKKGSEENSMSDKMHIRGAAKFATEEKALGDRQVRVIVSTESLDRDGDIIVAEGINLDEYRKNPVILWMHNHFSPIAKAEDVAVKNGQLEALIQFPPEGVDMESDRVYGLIKAGVLNATSIGFIPGEWTAMDPERPYGGRKYLTSEMYEFSIVSVGSNRDALVIERDHKGALTSEEQSELARFNVALIEEQKRSKETERQLQEVKDTLGEIQDAQKNKEEVERRKRIAEAKLKAAGL